MTRMRALAGLLLLMPMLALSADAAPPVSFKTDLQPVINAQCVFCHVTGAENGGLNLGRRVSHAALLAASTEAPAMPRVTPGDPARSYLIHKLKGTHLEAGGSGTRMPMNDPPRPLDETQLSLFVRWVESGAPDN